MAYLDRFALILKYIEDHPGCTRKEISEGLEVPMHGISQEMSSIGANGFATVYRNRDGNHYTISGWGSRRLEEIMSDRKIPLDRFGFRNGPLVYCFYCPRPILLEVDDREEPVFRCPRCERRFAVKEVD